MIFQTERLDMMANSSKEYINNYADHNEELVNIESNDGDIVRIVVE